jgi:iron complex outermembrane receptor protein
VLAVFSGKNIMVIHETTTTTANLFRGNAFRQRALTTVSAIALLAAVSVTSSQPVHAQEQTAQNVQLEEIIVTGSRVLRDGFEAPTPLTVISIEELQASAPENIADFVNELPSVMGSEMPSNSQTSISSGASGINSLDLRSMGSDRTLVLLDGQRSVASRLNGVTNVNNFPQMLIERVDVVTGGASAAYGSDAVSGVVNFVLDKDFTGFKGSVEGGVTSYGDNRNFKVSTAYGTPFSDGRGHFLFSGEVSAKAGILHSDRPWNREGWTIMNNPNYTKTNGQPERLRLPRVGLSLATPGGIITRGPLRGTAFGQGGTPYQFNYGHLVKDPYMQGGDWRSVQQRHTPSLDPRLNRQNVFLRTSYEVTENVEIFAQMQWGSTFSDNRCCPSFSTGNINIKPDNAFIPAEVAARVAALGLTSLRMGSMHGDLPGIGGKNNRSTNRYVVGGKGSFSFNEQEWNWDAYYQFGKTRVSSRGTELWNRAAFSKAIDAVRDPSTGSIVCRSSLTDPGNGCVPYSVFGTGVNSPHALAYLGLSGSGENEGNGGALRNERFVQNVAAVTLTGEPFSTWAGPVSVAVGAEWRKEKVYGVADAISASTRWFAGNYLPTHGDYSVTEGFLETVVPLVSNSDWAESLDLNAAIRLTDYSTSGLVTSYKVGATFSPIPDITFRATRSRDIRAPNLEELFQAGTANTNNVVDPFNNNMTTQYLGIRTGNLNLRPEKADTTGVGVVLQPSIVPGLSASVDYYNINITDAIDQVGVQTIVDRCFDGQTDFCTAITRGLVNGVNIITQIDIAPFNFATNIGRGMDFELAYQMPLANADMGLEGDLSFRLLATHYIKDFTDNGIDVPQQHAGENNRDGPPSWVYRASLTYSNDPLTVVLTGRGVSAGVIDNDFIECTSSCPTSTSTNRTINSNGVDSVFYLDTAISYSVYNADEDDFDAQVFFNVRNITNKSPPIVGGGPGGVAFSAAPTNFTLYDGIGRTFRAGVRFNM